MLDELTIAQKVIHAWLVKAKGYVYIFGAIAEAIAKPVTCRAIA